MKKFILSVALALASFTSNAQQSYISSGTLLGFLNGSEMERMTALGYIVATHDFGTGVAHCRPKAAGIVEMRDYVEAYLRANLKFMNTEAYVVVTMALGDLYPCKAKMGVRS